MKYIRTYESFKDSNKEKVNEELLGGLFKSLKNKLSLGFSKMFGSASAVDKLITGYKKELQEAQSKYKEALGKYGKYIKSIEEGAEPDTKKAQDLIKLYEKERDIYQKSQPLIKKKFDLKFKEATKDEENDKIKNYITLKKIEMEQEMIRTESESLYADTGLTEEMVKDNEFLNKIIIDNKSKLEKLVEASEKESKNINSEDSGSDSSFDFESAKKDPENFKWSDSKFNKEYKFESGEEIKIWMKKSSNDSLSTFDKDGDEYKGTTLFIASDEKQKELSESDDDDKSSKVAVTANKDDLNSGFTVLKSKIISTSKDDLEKEEEKKKKEESEEKESND